MGQLELILATYYIVAAITLTDGPFGVFWKLRQKEALPLHCAICLAPWAACAVLLASIYLPPVILTVLAIAGAVTALYEAIDRM